MGVGDAHNAEVSDHLMQNRARGMMSARCETSKTLWYTISRYPRRKGDDCYDKQTNDEAQPRCSP